MVIAVAACASAVRDGRVAPSTATVVLIVALVLWFFASRLVRQYEPDNGRGPAGDLALTGAMIAGVGVAMLTVSAAAPRWVPMAATLHFLAVVAPVVVLTRASIVGMSLWRAQPVADVLIAGIGALGRATAAEISGTDSPKRVIGYLSFSDERTSRSLTAPVAGQVADIEAVLRSKPVDEVYFASIAGDHHKDVQAAISVCERLGVPFALPVCTFRLSRARPVVEGVSDGYAHFMTVHVTPLEQAAKRLFDIVVSATGLLLISPVLVGAALAVKLTSRGPVLFHQERVGLLGRRFKMLKFRSMVQNAEALKRDLESQNEQQGPVFKMKNDPRVTPVGRFIRKYSIDELPQLVNVLRGDMSLVGPRPPLPSEVAKYEAWQLRRLSVRPGITCVWQVQGRSEISFDDWMLLDMRYIDHWSFARDVDLIMRTVPAVLRGRGAH
jgi:exopolysaccharide biosynthesis polyprenyl glycosylphosphotransferase